MNPLVWLSIFYVIFATLFIGVAISRARAERKAAELKPCDPEIFEKGKVVCIIGNMSARQVEELIVQASNWSDVLDTKMDWHFVAGRAVIKTLGDVADAKWALTCVLPIVQWEV